MFISSANDEKYLDLLKRSITGELDVYFLSNWKLSYDNSINKEYNGFATPGSVLTMIGKERLSQIQKLIKIIVKENIPGDILIAGCWRGGLCIFCKACLEVYEPNSTRKIYCADSFLGVKIGRINKLVGKMLAHCSIVLTKKAKRNLVNFFVRQSGFPGKVYSDIDIQRILKMIAVMPWHGKLQNEYHGVDEITTGFERYGLMDEHIKFLIGWFTDTLPKANIDTLALVYADADLYESTCDVLNFSYSKISKGGFFIVDDYSAVTDCKRAVDEYREAKKIDSELIAIDEEASYWRVN